ncbi:transcription antitermination factor NusB [Beduini massiliensis]|uniref:transcription antitermination factor NusB n=1 Tax=Beduini massiliensis TaxID=1585974 RepID=UPI00059AA398|nr:transcription antitermination factor NusB [Beduini massiliensis]
MAKTRRQIARETAMIAIYQYLLVDHSLEEIEAYISENKTIMEDEATYTFCKTLIDTTLLNLDQYRNEISKHLKKGWTWERLSKMEQAILLVATSEMLDSDLAKGVIINEAILIAKTYCDEESYKYINGVLHSLI